MTPTSAVEFVAWGVLSIFSVLTVGAVIDILGQLRRLARSLTVAGPVLNRARSILRGGSNSPHDVFAQLHPLLEHPMAAFASWLLRQGRRVRTSTAEMKIAELVSTVDGGRSNLLQAVSRLAPLAALGGTVAGVADSFGAFSGDAAAHAALYRGLSLALNTTFVGVVVAIVSYSLGAIHERHLERLEDDLRGLLMDTMRRPRRRRPRRAGPAPETPAPLDAQPVVSADGIVLEVVDDMAGLEVS